MVAQAHHPQYQHSVGNAEEIRYWKLPTANYYMLLVPENGTCY
jgi:hypothetical protein